MKGTTSSSKKSPKVDAVRKTANGSDSRSSPAGTSSPPNTLVAPKIVVKNEPPSPDLPNGLRHRPRKLDLASSNTTMSPGVASVRASLPHTARDNPSSTLAMHDVGLACLSPGFQTQDPSMQQQLQRSISVRDQQRHIIESRLQRSSARQVDSETNFTESAALPGDNDNSVSTRKKPPQGLSIIPPPNSSFENERVIQSAPLNQTFASRSQLLPLTRHVTGNSFNLSATSHIHQVPLKSAHSNQNRLPPLSDVFAAEGIGMAARDGMPPQNQHHERHLPLKASTNPHEPETSATSGYPANQADLSTSLSRQDAGPMHTTNPHLSHTSPTQSKSVATKAFHLNAPQDRTENDYPYRSTEDIAIDTPDGREKFAPRNTLHSGGRQLSIPPSPPLPPTASSQNPISHRATNGVYTRSNRRRSRAEYERDTNTPPLGAGSERATRQILRDPKFDHLEIETRKKDEFLSLCARAWDLFHS